MGPRGGAPRLRQRLQGLVGSEHAVHGEAVEHPLHLCQLLHRPEGFEGLGLGVVKVRVVVAMGTPGVSRPTAASSSWCLYALIGFADGPRLVDRRGSASRWRGICARLIRKTNIERFFNVCTYSLQKRLDSLDRASDTLSPAGIDRSRGGQLNGPCPTTYPNVSVIRHVPPTVTPSFSFGTEPTTPRANATQPPLKVAGTL